MRHPLSKHYQVIDECNFMLSETLSMYRHKDNMTNHLILTLLYHARIVFCFCLKRKLIQIRGPFLWFVYKDFVIKYNTYKINQSSWFSPRKLSRINIISIVCITTPDKVNDNLPFSRYIMCQSLTKQEESSTLRNLMTTEWCMTLDMATKGIKHITSVIEVPW